MREARYVSLIPRTTLHSDSEHTGGRRVHGLNYSNKYVLLEGLKS
jgi:hypothetical protein